LFIARKIAADMKKTFFIFFLTQNKKYGIIKRIFFYVFFYKTDLSRLGSRVTGVFSRLLYQLYHIEKGSQEKSYSIIIFLLYRFRFHICRIIDFCFSLVIVIRKRLKIDYS
jgi:hypothetical protein